MSVVVIGSSGGGTATLGHTNCSELLSTIHNELGKVNDKCKTNDSETPQQNLNSHGIIHSLYVALHDGTGMDSANLDTSIATLYSSGIEIIGSLESIIGKDKDSSAIALQTRQQFQVQAIYTGSLRKCNEILRLLDQRLAEQIRSPSSKVKGLICISCSIDLHKESLLAAVEQNLPVTGSGGSSLSAAATTMGIRLVGNAGGSVATNSYTRALSYTHALATAWGETYHPFASPKQKNNRHSTIRPQWRSVLNACLPAFWAACLTRRGISLLVLHLSSTTTTTKVTEILQMLMVGDDDLLSMAQHLLDSLENIALPTACCIVMATSYAPHHGSTAVLAASVASVSCHQSILGGLLAGLLVGVLLSRTLYLCVCWGIPATMSNLMVAGGVGSGVALMTAPLTPWLRQLSQFIRFGIQTSMEGHILGLGFTLGCIFCYGSKIGMYHSLFLPLILLEMETGNASILGAMDEATLVLVSAGICAANLVVGIPSPGDSSNSSSTDDNDSDSALCRRGLRINLMYGDFIEAAYPFMERYFLVNVAGYLASGISVEILAHQPEAIGSSAYMPVLVSIWLADDWKRLTISFVTAFGISFGGTLINNMLVRLRVQQHKKKT